MKESSSPLPSGVESKRGTQLLLILALVVTTMTAACSSRPTVSIHNTAPGITTMQIRLASSPQTIVISHDNREAFVSYGGSNAITIIDLETGKILRNLHMDGQVSDMALSPDGPSLYVALSYAESTTFDMQVVDTSTDSASVLLPLDPGIHRIRP